MDSSELTTTVNSGTQGSAQPEIETERPEVDIDDPETRIERISREILILTNPDLELEFKLGKITTLVDEERHHFEVTRLDLRGSELRDLFKTLAGGIDGLCKEANRLLMSWEEKIQRLREGVCGLSDALDARIREEDLTKWLVQINSEGKRRKFYLTLNVKVA